MPKPRRFPGLLNVHAEIDKIGQHLSVSLWLHVAAHHSERKEQLPVLQHHAGNECMERALSRRNNVRVLGLETKERSTVMKHNACIARDKPRAECFEQTVDERHSVAVLIYNG